MQEIHPLSTLTTDAASEWVKQRVTNVIRSYHNAADVIAEPIQNAVDEVLSADGLGDIGTVRIIMDTDENRISVWDNGRGISSTDIAKYLAPDIGSKRADFLKGLVRGHKGVGLTFLAYGFNYFTLESRTATEHYLLRLEGGRSWVEDPTLGAESPAGQLTHMDETGAPQGKLVGTGTVITIGLGPQTEPKSLRHAFPTAKYAAVAIQNQTAVGVIEPPSIPKKRPLAVTLEYKSNAQTTVEDILPVYRFPHMGIPASIATLNLGEWLAQNKNTEPKAKDRKAYHACYQVFDPNSLLELIDDRTGDKLDTVEDVAHFVRSHDVHVYCLFSFSASYRDQLRESWAIPANRKSLYSPSLRIATDGMISSWSREVTLTHRGFNVDRTWLVYNFRAVEPDLGRKDFPPEVRDFIGLSEEVVANNVATNSRPFLRIAPSRSSGGGGTYVAPSVKAFQRREKPLSPSWLPGFGDLRMQTEPESEQDVIALFSELVGLGPFRHFRPVFYSGFDYYDSFFTYNPTDATDEMRSTLPGTDDTDERDREGVAEFKFVGDSIIEDVVANVKRWNEMTFVICWDIGKAQRLLGGDEVTFDEPVDAVNRRYHGVTHLARMQSAGEHTVFVIALKEVLRRLSTSDA